MPSHKALLFGDLAGFVVMGAGQGTFHAAAFARSLRGKRPRPISDA